MREVADESLENIERKIRKKTFRRTKKAPEELVGFLRGFGVKNPAIPTFALLVLSSALKA